MAQIVAARVGSEEAARNVEHATKTSPQSLVDECAGLGVARPVGGSPGRGGGL